MRVEMTPRRYAQVGVVFGLSVSTWANVARAWPHGWGARLMAAVWPTIVYLAIEVLARTSWGGRLAKWSARVAAVVVGLVAAYLSYRHLAGLLESYGEPKWSARLGPLGIDGLMAVCAAARLNREPDADAPVGPADEVADSAPEPKPEPRNLELPPASPTPVAPKPQPRRVNGRDLRVTEARQLIKAARSATPPQPDPTVNAVATALGVTWKTAQPIREKALTELGGHR